MTPTAFDLDTDPTDHTCRRGPRCHTRQPGPDGGWAGGPATRDLCDTCTDACVDALAAAPHLHHDLRAAARDRTPRPAGDHVRTSRPGSFGLNLTPLDLADQLHWTVTTWADEVAHTAGRPTVDRTHQPEPDQITDACLLLRTYLPVLLAHTPVEFALTRDTADPDDPRAAPTTDTRTTTQAGWQAASWLIDFDHTARRCLRTTVLVHRPPEPCPACNVERVLRRRDGDDKVTCTNCGKAWTLAMYETFVHAWIGAA